MTAARHIILALLLILAQAAIDNYVNMTVYLDIALCLYIVLTLPPRWGAIPSMIVGFAVGIIVDVLGNGIIGMSAAAMTAVALCRKTVFRIAAPREKEKRQDIGTMGLRNFILYTLPLTLVYLLVYILLDSSGFRPAGQNLIRTGISLAANTAIMGFLYAITSDNGRRK